MRNGNRVNKSVHRKLFRYFSNDFNGKLVVMVHAVADRLGNRFVNALLSVALNSAIPKIRSFLRKASASGDVR
jgi:hypothetical protein